RALEHYRQILNEMDQRPPIAVAARIRLVSALLGREFGKPITAAVEIGGTTYSPAQLEQLVAEFRETRKDHLPTPIIASESAAADFQTPPAPHAYETHVRGRFDGDLGKNAG